MKNNCVFFQQEFNSNSHSINPFDSTFNPSKENLINRKAVALDLPVLPEVKDYNYKINTSKEENPIDNFQNIIDNNESYNRVEAVPYSELRFEPINESFNTLELIFLVIIILSIFKVFTSKSLFSKLKKDDESGFKIEKNIKTKDEKYLDKVKKLNKLIKKHNRCEISTEEFEEMKKKLYNE